MGQVTLRGVRKSFGSVDVIKGIELEVNNGEFLVFVGPSGCGKSTTLRMIAGLETITAGELLIDGVRANDLRPSDRGAAIVFQSYALYPHMTVAENMGFALKMAGVGKAERAQQVGRAAEILRITDYLGRFGHALLYLGPGRADHAQAERHVFGHRHVRVQRVALEHHRQAALFRRHVVHAPAIDLQLAACDVLQSGDAAQQRALATARGADEDDEFAVAHLQVDAVQYRRGGKCLVDAAQGEGRHGEP